MGDCLRAGKPSCCVTSRPDQLGLAIPPLVSALAMVAATAREENG